MELLIFFPFMLSFYSFRMLTYANKEPFLNNMALAVADTISIPSIVSRKNSPVLLIVSSASCSCSV